MQSLDRVPLSGGRVHHRLQAGRLLSHVYFPPQLARMITSLNCLRLAAVQEIELARSTDRSLNPFPQ